MVATLDGIADGTPGGRARSRPTVSRWRPRSPSTTPAVDWTAPARHVDRLVRACTPAPGAWTTFRGERLKLGPVRLRGGARPRARRAARRARTASRSAPATIDVELGTVQPPGKRPMPAADWARGARIEPGERLG